VRPLELVGYTADLTSLVLASPETGERHRVPVDGPLVRTLAEVLQLTDEDARRDLLAGLVPVPAAGGRSPAVAAEGPSAAAALLALGRAAAGPAPPRPDGSSSRLTPSEIQRLLRAGRPPESVAEQADVALEWVLRWYQPIAAEQRKVIASVRGARQDRPGFGLSDDVVGEAVRLNLLARGVEADDAAVEWTAARPEGRPYWTVTLRFSEQDRVRRATWRYDIGTGTVAPRDDLAADLGWSAPVTHPSPGRLHVGGSTADDDGDAAAPPRSAPPPPSGPRPARWAPPAPPPGPRRR
jgi:hypothetical protein